MAEAKRDPDRTRLVVLLVTLALVAAVAGVRFWGRAGIAGDREAAEGLEYSARGLPSLEMLELENSASGSAESARNPFAFGPPPTPTPNLTPPPTRPPLPTRAPRPTPTPRIALGADGQPKPPPPPFDRDFIGYFGPAELQVAAFRKNDSDSGSDDIEVAAVGDVLDGTFIVREIGLESVVIGFVGYDPSEDTRVPLSDK